MTVATAAKFTHPNSYVGNLTIENGLDAAQWAYQLNTQVYPTYGGEIIQILSVYIDDLTLQGSVTTYRQAELIYEYFARYMQVATQGRSGTPDVSSGDAYNLKPMIFTYPMRQWVFYLYPKSAPGFAYDVKMVNPTWSISAHVLDMAHEGDTLGEAKTKIKEAVMYKAQADSSTTVDAFGTLTDQISPESGDPNTDPFQTFDESAQQASQALGGLSDYYASMVNGYQNGNFSAITAGLGSKPSSTSNKHSTPKQTKHTKKPPKVVGGKRIVSN